MSKARSGCSGLVAFLFLACAFVAIYHWPKYLDANGSQATGTLVEKRESVRVHWDVWYRRFEIIAAFAVPGQPVEHRAICDVDEQTYDSLHPGNRVSVHYLPNFLNQPFIPATHLSPCTSAASINWNASVIRNLAIAFAILLVILFLWRILRIGIAGLLLIPWACLIFVYIAIPRLEPAPTQPVHGKATIWNIVTISRLLSDSESRGIALQHRYQIVELKFTPPGMDTPVVAVDKIDLNSVRNLAKDQTVEIVYDSAHPRIARIVGGTRLFRGQALTTVLLTAGALFVLLIAVALLRWFFRLLAPNRASRAVKLAGAVRRPRRR
jgi:hypothetical protein